jgi:hypothetical protein
VNLYRERFAHHGHGTPEQAIVGLGGHAFIAERSQDAVRQFRPYFEVAVFTRSPAPAPARGSDSPWSWSTPASTPMAVCARLASRP